MNQIYTPTESPDEWRWLLSRPGRHWKYGASAMSLADAWENANGWPDPVASALSTDPALADAEFLLGLPEHLVALPGGSTASQSDLFALARATDGSLAAIAVEGKAAEPFGNDNVATWRADASSGRLTRLDYLLGVLGLDDDERLRSIQYQLLHRTASAVIEARRFGARHAVMVVHSFSPSHARFDDFTAFATLYGANIALDTIAPARDFGDVVLHLGWVSDAPRARSPEPAFGPRLDRAFALARELHVTQVRKGTATPYVAHLLGVASLVLDDGGDEDEAIAGLLHDAVEDQGGASTLRRMSDQFGSRVADIIRDCSDSDGESKQPWRERKVAYIAHLESANRSVLRVSMADKLHNARAIVFDVRARGDEVWRRFNAPADEVFWYYDELSKVFTRRAPGSMAAELRRTVEDMRGLVQQVDSQAAADPS